MRSRGVIIGLVVLGPFEPNLDKRFGIAAGAGSHF